MPVKCSVLPTEDGHQCTQLQLYSCPDPSKPKCNRKHLAILTCQAHLDRLLRDTHTEATSLLQLVPNSMHISSGTVSKGQLLPISLLSSSTVTHRAPAGLSNLHCMQTDTASRWAATKQACLAQPTSSNQKRNPW